MATNFIYRIIGKIPPGLPAGSYDAEFIKLEVKKDLKGKIRTIMTMEIKGESK